MEGRLARHAAIKVSLTVAPVASIVQLVNVPAPPPLDRARLAVVCAAVAADLAVESLALPAKAEEAFVDAVFAVVCAAAADVLAVASFADPDRADAILAEAALNCP